MKQRVVRLATFLILVLQASCAASDPQASIAGTYTLAKVDDRPVPCCGAVDSTGAHVTTVAATLTLGAANSEAFAATPAGLVPSSCVHEVPNGASIDDSKLRPCGDGDFTLTMTERLDYADGSSSTRSQTSVGRYAWSDEQRLIVLEGVQLSGTVIRQNAGALLAVSRSTFSGTDGPTYTFAATP